MNGWSMWLKSQVFCVMPEQVLLSVLPGQPPLSRWIAQIDRKFMLLAWTKLSIGMTAELHEVSHRLDWRAGHSDPR